MTAVRDIATTPNPSPSYDEDYAAWIEAQVALLRAGRLSELDLDNIAEELGDLGRSDVRSLRSAMANVLLHMLKWDHQPERRSRSWIVSIGVGRGTISDLLGDSPSLRPRLASLIAEAYARARGLAADETGLDRSTFPEACIYSLDDIMSRAHTLQSGG
jgi:hypothetical protein